MQPTILYEPNRSRPLSDFQAELRFEFPDLPSQLFDYYLVKTARTMAKDGKLIRRQAAIQATQNINRYRLQSPDGMEICAILDIRHQPACSCIVTATERSFVAPEGAYSCQRNVAWYDDTEGVLHVVPPWCHGAYFVSLAVLPAMDACELPEKFLTDHLSVLLTGTRASIFLISGRPWTNLPLGQALYNEFQKSIPSEAIEVSTHGMRGGIRMQHGRVL